MPDFFSTSLSLQNFGEFIIIIKVPALSPRTQRHRESSANVLQLYCTLIVMCVKIPIGSPVVDDESCVLHGAGEGSLQQS